MANFFTKIFSQYGGGSQPQIDPMEAATALLVELARVDGAYNKLEKAQILKLLTESFDLTDAAAEALLQRAEIRSQEATDTYALTKDAKTLAEAKRALLVESLYRIALTDGSACKFEEAFIRQVASLLYIDDVTRARARFKATQSSLRPGLA